MDLSFHYLVMAEHSILQKKLLSCLKNTGLTIGQPKILDYLKDHNGASQKEIARGCHIEPGTLTSLLNRMEETDLVERRMQDGNRRSYYIFLKEKGVQQLETVTASFAQLEEKAFRGLSQKERETFMELFLRIYKNTEAQALLPEETITQKGDDEKWKN